MLIVFALAAAATMPTVPVLASSPTPRAASGAAPGLAWMPCAEAPDDPAVRCATVRVPVDWSRPHGPSIDLALARRAAAEPQVRIGTLLFDLGGPGSSGVDAVLAGGPNFSADISRRFDIVGIDPRGIGRSHPVLCSSELVAQIPHPYPAAQPDLDRIRSHNERLRADCRHRTGPLFDHVDTRSVARDLDAVRAALDESRITFYGISYGTVLAGQYAELYPHRVRAMVLDSVLDHSLDGRGLLDAGAIALQDSYDQFATWCDAEPTCALHGRVRTVTAELFTRIERNEIIFPSDPPRAATPFDLVDLFQQVLSLQLPAIQVWHGLADGLLIIHNEAPAEPAAHTTAQDVRFPGRAVRCADFHMPVRDHAELVRHLHRAGQLAPDTRFAADRLDQMMFCLGTPTPIANPQHRLRIRTSVPLLLVNNRHDPITGYTMATNVAAQLGRFGRLLTNIGWGHGVYNESACTVGAIDRYLISLALPAPGAHCIEDPSEPAAAQHPTTLSPLAAEPKRWQG